MSMGWQWLKWNKVWLNHLSLAPGLRGRVKNGKLSLETHPPSASLAKRRGENAIFLKSLSFLREGFRVSSFMLRLYTVSLARG